MTVYLVEKQIPVIIQENGSQCTTTLSFTEAVFNSEKKATEYIVKRKQTRDRDDKGCTFIVSPWRVE